MFDLPRAVTSSLLAVLVVLVAAEGAMGQPANDNFVNRFTLFSSLLTNTVNAGNQNATKQSGEPNHAGNAGGHSVWWTWTAPVTATVTLDTVGSSFDTLLAVYTGNSVSTLTNVAGDDDSGGNKTSLLTFSAVEGTAYQIAVDGWSGASGNFILHIYVAATAPQITSQPQPQAVLPGTNVGFGVVATGTAPVSYSWRKNGASILGATNANYGVSNAQTTDAGTYTVVLTNPVGSVTSSPAVLTVQLLPSNDNLANALLVSGISNTWLGNNLYATKEVGEPYHAGYAGGKSVWWSWTAPTNGMMALNTSGSSFNTLVAVYTGNIVSNLNLVSYSGGFGGSRLTFDAVAGTIYKIAVDGEFVGTSGHVELTLLPPPPNDTFAKRAEISGTPATVYGYNFNATREPGEPAHAGIIGTGSVWWKWVAPSNGIFVIDAIGSSYNTPLAVYTGNSVSNLTVVGSVYGGYSDEPVVVINAVAGVEYDIAVAGSYYSGGNIVLTVRSSPPNDAFANRIPIAGHTLTVTGYNFAATTEAGEPNPLGLAAGKSVWWTWTADSDLAVSLDSSGSTFDAIVGVFTGNSVSSLALVTAYYGVNPGALRLAGISGTTYQIAVYAATYGSGNGNITLNLHTATPPSNDSFANRILLTGMTNTANANNSNATRELGEPDHADYGPVDRSVWWKWIAPTNGTVTLESTGSPQLAVYTGGSVAGLFLIAKSSESRIVFYGVAGTEYEIAAAGNPGGAIMLHLQQVPTPSNDAFAERITILGLTKTLAGYSSVATKEPGEPNHAGNSGGKSLWWTWVAPTNATVTVDTIGSTFDTLLGVYTGVSVSNLTLVASNDDRGGDRTSKLSFQAMAGTSYQIAVDGWISAGGYILMNLQAVTTPPNDAFDNRIEITGMSNTVSGDITGASLEPGEPIYGGSSVWWKWTAPAFGEVIVEVTGNVSYVEVHTGNSISNLTRIGLISYHRVSFAGFAGMTYQIAVNGGSGIYALSVQQSPPPTPFQITSQPQSAIRYVGNYYGFSIGVAGVGPIFFQWRKDGVDIPGATNTSYVIPNLQITDAGIYSVVVSNSVNTLVSSNAILTVSLDYVPPGNDVFANRFTMGGLTNTVTGSNVFATKEAGEPNHAGNSGGSSVWWTWTAPTNWTVTLDTIGSTFDTVIAVYTGNTVSGLTNVASDRGSAGTSTTFPYFMGSRLTFTAVTGVSYQIAVDGYSGYSGDVVLNLRSAPQPLNDAFENSFPIAGLSISAGGNNQGATKEASEPNHGSSLGGKSVWWTWTAPTNGTVTVDTMGSSFDTLLAVYTGGSLPALSLVAGDDEGGTNHSSELSFFAVVGTEYHIAVDGYGADSGNFLLQLHQNPSAVTPVNVAFEGNWPGFRTGRARDITVVGTLAYAAIGEGGLLTLDVSDPEHPRRIGSLDTPGDARSVTVAGGFAYVADGPAGIHILDVNNPALPSFIGVYSALTNVNKIAVRGSFAYVADGTEGLQILDISNKANPVRVSAVAGQARTVVVDGNYAYVCEGTSGLRIINITTPNSPVTTSLYASNIFGQSVFYMSVAVTNGYAFVLDSYLLNVIAVTNPFSPVLLNGVFLESPNTVFAVGGISMEGNSLYVAFRGEIQFVDEIDISDPMNPTIINSFGDFALADLLNVHAANGYVFAINGSQGFAIFEESQRNSHPLSFFYTTPKSFNLAVQGNYVYLANGVGGLQIVNIADPKSPTLIGGSSTGAVHAVGTFGSYVLAGILSRLPSPSQGYDLLRLACLDVSEPALPRFAKSLQVSLPLEIATSSGNRAYCLSGSYAQSMNIVTPDDFYLRSETYNFDTYDLTDRERPVLLNSEPNSFPNYFGSLRARSLSVKGNYAFFAGECGQCLKIMDLTDHSQRFTQPTTGNVRALTVAENRLAVAEDNGLEVFDISSPTKPSLRGRFGVVGYSDVAMAGQYIVAVNTNTGLHVIDASTTNLVEVGMYAITGCEKVVLAGNYALIAQGAQGLTILDLGPSFASAPRISFQPQNKRALAGANIRFDVGANGTVPLSYQWFSGGTNIPGATNFVLTLANVQANQVGQYSVVISNSVGFTVSSNAVLSVDSPPSVTLTSPGDGEAFIGGASIPLEVTASDSDGYVSRVEFYNGANLLSVITNTVVTNTMFSAVWSNVAVGTYTLTARATDNEGATAVSSPATVIVITNQVFQLSKSNYEVNESNAVVTVTVRRNTGGPASVNCFTLNGTAFSVPPGGIGSYRGVTNLVTFPSNVLTANIEIGIVNDLVNRGDRQFVVQLSDPANGWQVAFPSNAYVTIIDDDPLTNNFADVVLPPTGLRGSLQVWLAPTNALGKWRFWWETEWRDSGNIASNLLAGDYVLEVMPSGGFTAPNGVTNTIIAGAHLVKTNTYTQLVGVIPTGNLSVTILPPEVASAANPTNRGQWRLTGASTNWNDSGVTLGNILEGAHLVEFKSIPGYDTPAQQITVVFANQSVGYEGGYTPALAAVANGPVALDSYFTITNDATQFGTPYRFSGQLFSDAGLSSGFVVKPRTVLTAAHTVFDPVRLTFATNVWWFFQRQRGEYEPLAQQPRGWQVFEGYAALRTNNPFASESSIEIRNLDVAALYFFEDAGRGGYGGYLITATNADWLASSLQKILVGYPVDVVPEAHRGKMHQSGQLFFAAFQKVTNQVYRSDQITSYGGNSGGPLCVLSTNSLGRGFFIPVAVYLGGSGETVVRAIDLDVVDLINRAENASHGGTNSTGGGVIPISSVTGRRLNHPGYLSISIGPPAAVRLGAVWRVSPTNYGELNDELRFYTNFTSSSARPSVQSTNFTIEATNLSGFLLLSNPPIVITEGSTRQLPFTYVVQPPWLTYDPNTGLGMTGTVGTSYRIEGASQLTEPDWLMVTNNFELKTGTNWILNTTPTSISNRFYRALWLPE